MAVLEIGSTNGESTLEKSYTRHVTRFCHGEKQLDLQTTWKSGHHQQANKGYLHAWDVPNSLVLKSLEVTECSDLRPVPGLPR